jgi:uncharacterized protein (UPF0332 family)
VKPETGRYLAKARRLLMEARTAAGVDLTEAAGRASYLAAFHAAQALIFERSGNVSKTHRGVHIQFARLTKDEPGISSELREFLPQSYNLKAVADYEVGADATVPLEEAIAAIETAERFVDRIAELVGGEE